MRPFDLAIAVGAMGLTAAFRAAAEGLRTPGLDTPVVAVVIDCG